MNRPTIEATMLDIAIVLSERGTCCKKKVGCVITDKNGHILSTGYNGQPKGFTHCTLMLPCPAFADPTLSCNAIHAEMNALVRCSDIDKIHAVYITEAPCPKCRLLIRNTSASRLIYLNEQYQDLVEEKL